MKLKKLKTTKISNETHRRLVKVVGMLQAKEGKRKTVEDAVVFLHIIYYYKEKSRFIYSLN